MRRVAVAIAALGAVGCAEIDPQEFDNLSKDETQLKLKIEKLNSNQTLLYERVVANVEALNKKVAEMDGLVRAMRASVERMEDQVKMLQANPPTGAAGSASPEAKGPNTRLEDILREIDTTLRELGAGKLRKEEAAQRLKPYAKDAAPKILDEIEASTTKFEYTKQLEYILAQMPPAELKVPLQRALAQGGVQESAARVIGATRDASLSRLLEEYVAVKDEDFRLIVGEALVQCRNPVGIPILIQSLKSDQEASRTISIASLRKINRGEDFGYRALLSVDQNAAALRSWSEWADKFGKTIFE
jgi:hypothetical protein